MKVCCFCESLKSSKLRCQRLLHQILIKSTEVEVSDHIIIISLLMFSLQVIFKFSNSLQVVFSIGNSLQVVFSISSSLYSLFSNILNFFQIKQWIQAETYSETCQASKMEHFAKLGSGCYEIHNGGMVANSTRTNNGCQFYQLVGN